MPFFDVLDAHVRDYSAFALSSAEYARRLFNGHYTPAGNHFFGFAVKDALVAWLDPVPSAYASAEASFAVQAGRLA